MRPLIATLLVLLVAGCGGGDRPTGVLPDGIRVDVVATGLEIPWEIAFLPDGSALVTERPGRIRLLEADGRLRDEAVATVDVSARGEGGLMGLALDPEFAGNGFVYLYFTTTEGLKLERWRYEDGALARESTLVSDIAAGERHDSGRIGFGPDDRLYVATGDAADVDLPQDDGSLNGKYLRLTPEQYRGDGEVRPEIVSKGHRNPQGFDWQPGSGRLVSTEHGPSGNDGPQGFDEINIIEPGGDYGWPAAYGRRQKGFDAPIRLYRDAIAPGGATFLEADSRWRGDYLFAALRGAALHRLRFEGAEIAEEEVLLKGDYGRLRTVVEGPDGALYVLTSNRDGRGTPDGKDDRILRITPPEPGSGSG